MSLLNQSNVLTMKVLKRICMLPYLRETHTRPTVTYLHAGLSSIQLHDRWTWDWGCWTGRPQVVLMMSPVCANYTRNTIVQLVWVLISVMCCTRHYKSDNYKRWSDWITLVSEVLLLFILDISRLEYASVAWNSARLATANLSVFSSFRPVSQSFLPAKPL
jgi:hypothetical protein